MMTGWFSRWYSRKAARVIVTNATLGMGMTFDDRVAASAIALLRPTWRFAKGAISPQLRASNRSPPPLTTARCAPV
jgi:hypothetical protein